MSRDEMVIVVTPLSVHRHRTQEVFAARLEELGLTAYGRTESVAVDRVKRMFNKFVTVHRQDGRLEKKLDHVGVEWYWKSEYPRDAQDYEDTNKLGSLANATSAGRHSRPAISHRQSQFEIVPMSQRLAA